MTRAPTEADATLKDMLRAAEVLDGSPRIKEFSLKEAIGKVIIRAINVVEGCDRDSKRYEIADAILRDAGLK